MARQLEGSGVTVNAVHPGHVATNIWNNDLSIFGPVIKLINRLIAITPQQGADTLIYLASSPDVAQVTGKYFIKGGADSPENFLGYYEFDQTTDEGGRITTQTR